MNSNLITRLIIAVLILSFVGCKQNKTADVDVKLISESIHPGKKLMETQCLFCHNPETNSQERVAPTMQDVKAHYMKGITTKEQFQEAMSSWLKSPSESTSKMSEAIKKYGIMPFTYYSDETLAKITDYIYTNDLNISEPADSSKNFEAIGINYALSTKKVLGKNLMGTIQKHGTVAALKFCNEKAYTLTDSMAKTFSATIKRVSDKPRNPNNKANQTELENIAIYKKELSAGKELNARIIEQEQEVTFFYPITTNSMCLQCHGTPNDQIKPESFKTLKALYPSDQAVNYDVNELRGIWSITFKKDNE